MANLKGAKACLETINIKPNYSELGRIYGIDRRTAKKRYEGITTKEIEYRDDRARQIQINVSAFPYKK